MTALLNSLAKAEIGSLLAPAARTATATGTGVDMLDYEGQVLVVLDSTAGGVGATMDVTLEESAVSGSGYTAITGGAFTQVGNAASQQKKAITISATKRYVRAVATIAGTASFVSAVAFVGHKKYQ